MAKDSEAAQLARCVAADPRVLLTLYADFLTESPEDTALPALALRDQARAGKLDLTYVPILTVALVDAPNNDTFLHLAKALAAFGHAAQTSAPFVVERLSALSITDDGAFWTLDGGLWCLGHLGGDVAADFVRSLQKESPPRVQRSKSVYRGTFNDDERQELFEATLQGVTKRLQAGDSGGWRGKQTTMTILAAAEAPKKMSPWMIR